jgi:hypothetical protein
MIALIALLSIPLNLTTHEHNKTTPMFPHRGLTTCSVKENEMADLIITEVEYRDVVGFPGYRIGTDGTLLTCRHKAAGMTNNWRQISGSWFGSGKKKYLVATLRRDGVMCRKLMHHLVLETFVGPRPLGFDGCHNNDDASNNSLSNLRWATRQDNINDRARNGRTARGEGAGLAKLTEYQVLAIREMASQGIAIREIAKKFPVGEANIGEITSGRTWKHVGGQLTAKKKRLCIDVVVAISKESKDIANNLLAKKYSVSTHRVWMIRSGLAWGNVTGIRPELVKRKRVDE